jgi:hypothetical protein
MQFTRLACASTPLWNISPLSPLYTRPQQIQMEWAWNGHGTGMANKFRHACSKNPRPLDYRLVTKYTYIYKWINNIEIDSKDSNDFWDDRLITNSYITQQLKFEQDDKLEMLKNTYSSQIYFSICTIQYVIHSH